MARRYVVDSPADLATMEAARLLRSGTIGNVARVWSAAKKQGKAGFDGRVFVVVDPGGSGPRHAVVYRVGADKDVHEMAELKYNTALKWCDANLRSALT